MDKKKIMQDVENILCECDPDTNIDDQQLDLMIERLTDYIIKIKEGKE